MKRPVPVNAESSFGFDELFFSTTDLRGVIRYGNDVFVRVSNYSRDQLMNAPHSIIRHPDMPRAVFSVLWSTIQAGQPIVAYVKNLSADGHFYWVLAFVFPIQEGYLSIRVKPSSNLFSAVQQIYAKTLAVEKEKELEESVAFLVEEVKKAGFKSYQEFMVKAAFAELEIIENKKPEEQIPLEGLSNQISEISHKAAVSLKDCFHRVHSLQQVSQSFVLKMAQLTQAFQNLKFISLNMTISAAKFGEDAASLGVVAKEFSTLSEQIQELLKGLSDFINNLSDVVERCAVRIVSLETQMMMVDFFIDESLKKINTQPRAFSEMLENRENFSLLFREFSEGLAQEIFTIEKSVDAILGQMSDVRKFTTGLEVIRQIGAVESARENEMKQTFVHYLDEMKKFIHLLQASTEEIQKEMQDQKLSAKIVVATASHLSSQVGQIFDLAGNNEAHPAGGSKGA